MIQETILARQLVGSTVGGLGGEIVTRRWSPFTGRQHPASEGTEYR